LTILTNTKNFTQAKLQMFSNSKLFFLATALLSTQYVVDAASFHKMTPADLGYFDTAQYKLQTAAQKLNDLW